MQSLIPGTAARTASAAELAVLMTSQRAQLLALFDGFEATLPELKIGFDPLLNLPLWELGHIGWFEEFWLARNPERARGAAADPLAQRPASAWDALYDSSAVAHATRWQLDLPDPAATRRYLAEVRVESLSLLARSGPEDDALYFFRLALFHEAMHIEAWHVMAQHLGVDLGPAMSGRAPQASALMGEWQVPGGDRLIGSAGPGFAFDNELGAHTQPVEAFSIDRAPVTWRRYLPSLNGHSLPKHLQHSDGGWQQRQFGRWQPLNLDAPALHLSAHQAAAWCQWANRRLPTEVEWETAALLAASTGEAFDWGQAWEWTASPFAPYPGFSAHPYRDYSQPWFDDGRPVLRGASFATSPSMRHPRYRNFFPAERADVFAGFRSCAVWRGLMRR